MRDTFNMVIHSEELHNNNRPTNCHLNRADKMNS